MVAFACNDCGNLMKGFATSCSRCGKNNLSISSADAENHFSVGAAEGKSLSEQLTDKANSQQPTRSSRQKQTSNYSSTSNTGSASSSSTSNSTSSNSTSSTRSTSGSSSWSASSSSSQSGQPTWNSGSESAWNSGSESAWNSGSESAWNSGSESARNSGSESSLSSGSESSWNTRSESSWNQRPESTWNNKRTESGWNSSSAKGSQSAASTTSSNKKEKPQERPAGFGTLIFGFIIPTAAIVFETQTHFCALNFFDPFPSLPHILFFSLIPFTSLMAWIAGRRKFNPDTDMSTHAGVLSLFSGMAMGIAVLYSLMFLPMAPLSILAILFLGFGLLGLSPMLSMPCIVKSGRVATSLAERENSYADPHQLKHVGHLIILVMVIALELPSTLTRINLAQAADADPKAQIAALNWLRSYGSEEVLLRACYERSGRATDILGSLWEFSHSMSVNTARDVFYKVTGKPFNTVPIPTSARATIQHAGIMSDPEDLNAGVEDEFDYDADIAGEIVSGVARGLSVSTSKISGTVDPDATLANLQWAFTLSNTSKFDREARAKILLPPNAVVNKATLTVNGEERDAVIMGRSEARAVYRRAVAEKKDPLLVSMCGPDLLLVQCFPVRPDDKMLVKIYMAAPMQMTKADHASLMLPAFDERNFQIDVHHDIELTSKGKSVDIACKELKTELKGDTLLVSGAVDTAELARGDTTLSASRNPQVTTVFANAYTEPTGQELVPVVHSINEAQLSPAVEHYSQPTTLTVLIDGSVGMAPFLPQVMKGLEAIPTSLNTKYVLLKDEEKLLTGAKDLADVRCEGGQENVSSLVSALNERNNGGAVLWIHAAQPICPKTTKAIVQSIFRYPNSPVLLYDMQVVASANEILDGVNTMSSIVRVHRTGSAEVDLKNLFHAWQQPVQTTGGGTGLKVATNQSLCDLEAYRQVRELLAKNNFSAAARIAQGQHIITPVTSAVVTMNLPANNPAPVAKAPNTGRRSYGVRGLNGIFNVMSLGKVGESFDGAATFDSAANERSRNKDYEMRMGETAPKCEEAKSISAAASPPYRTSGALGPQAGNAEMVQGGRANFAADEKGRFDGPAQELDQLSSQGDNGAVSGGGPAEDTGTAASAPESDTWLLLAVMAALTGAALYLKKRGVAVKA